MQQNIYDNNDFFEGYRQLRTAESGLNTVLEEPAIYALLPDLKGLHILDLGCGFGRFSRYAANQGATTVTGVDISERMLAAAAQEDNPDNITYLQSPIETATFPPDSFDLIVSSLALHYIQDYRQLTARMFTWLRPGGQLTFTVEHPMSTAREEQQWITDETGHKLYWPVDHYHDESIRHTNWFVDDVIKYHRTTATYVNTLLTAGFTLHRLEEPTPLPEFVQQRPELNDQFRRPPFLLLSAKK